MTVLRFKVARCLAFVGALCVAGASMAQPPKHNYDLIDVNWSISFDEDKATINGDVTNTLAPTENGVTKIALNSGKLDIHSVTVDGAAANFSQEGESLIVDLPREVSSGTSVKVRIVYSGKPQAGVYFSSPDRSSRKTTTRIVYTQGEAEDTRYWLPTYDEPDDKATSEGHITVPKGYYALSNGRLIDVIHGPSTDTYHWKMPEKHSTYLISFVAGRYKEFKETWGDLPVNFYVPEGTESMGPPAFGGTNDMVRFYSELTGTEYPYPKFAQSAVSDFPFGGMENISAVTQTIDALHPAAESDLDDVRGLVLHELAHQWFGDLITCSTWSSNWLNEGWATFLPHFYFRLKDGEEAYQRGKVGDIDAAIGSMRGSPRPMVALKYEVPMDIFDGHAYPGGSARMFMLQAMLGEKLFWKCVKQYLADWGYKPVSTDEFFESMSKSSGRDLSQFDKEWFHTASLPTVTVSRDGHSVKLSQTEPLFTLDLDLWSLHEGHWSKQTVTLHSKEASATVDDPNDPILVDPNVNWVADIQYAKPRTAEELQSIYAHAPGAAAKMRLIQAASNQGYQDLLVSMCKAESSKVLRQELAGRIGADRTEYLLDLSHDPDLRVRHSAVNTLGRGAMTETVVARLREMRSSESSVVMKQSLVEALLNLTKDVDLANEAWGKDSFNDGYRTTALNWFAQNRPDDAREMALKALIDGHGEAVRNTAIRTLGALKDRPGDRRVFKALIELLGDKGHREKQAAIGALESYGDRAAIPDLERFNTYSMYQIRQAAKRVIHHLEEAKP